MTTLNFGYLFKLTDSRKFNSLDDELTRYPKITQQIFKIKSTRLLGEFNKAKGLAKSLLETKLQLYDRYHVIAELAEIYRSRGILRENRNIFDRYLGNLKGIYDFNPENVDLENYYKHRVQSEFIQIYLYTLSKEEMYFDLVKLFSNQIIMAQQFKDRKWESLLTIKLAEVYWVNNNFKPSVQTFRLALTIAEEENDEDTISTILTNLIELNLQYKKYNDAQTLVNRLQKMHEQNPENHIVELNYDWSTALLAKSELTILGLSKASHLFSKIIYSPHINAYYTTIAIYHLSEIFFIELKLNGNYDNVNRINSLAVLLEPSTELSALAIRLLIKSKLNIIDNDMEEARKNIIRSYEIGSITNDSNVVNLFSKELELFFEQRDFVKLLNTTESIKVSSNLRYFNVKQDEDPFNTEESLYFLIATDYGIHIFSHQFPNVDKVQEELIAGFLSAINAFINDAFGSESGYIEKINHKDFTIIMRKYKQFFFVYVFRGVNEFVHDRISKIINDISHILDSINVSGVIHVLKREKQDEISRIISAIFQ